VNKTHLVFVLLLVLDHFQGLVGVGRDDLEDIPLSIDRGKPPLSGGAVGWVVCLDNGLVASVVSDDLYLALLFIVKGKTV